MLSKLGCGGPDTVTDGCLWSHGSA